MTSRRNVVKGISLLPLLAASSACTTPLFPPAGELKETRFYTPSGVPLRRVNVAGNRLIRTVAGLRPFRRSGFRVEKENIAGKTLIHNYGHGGGGISLSWGTAHLAMELAQQTEFKRCAVLGAGAVGLATARLMQDRGWNVTIYARELSPHTTSNIAGGQWSPTSVYDDEFLTPGFAAQFERASNLAHRYFQNLVGTRYGVKWLSNYELRESPQSPGNFTERYAHLYPELRDLFPVEHPFPARYVRHYNTMLIEPAIYLPAMMEDVYAAGGRIVVREFTNRNEIFALEEPLIINCTGLGSLSLFDDRDMLPIKGQLSFLLPQEEVKYLLIADGGLYMFPRGDGILLGGSFERNQWSPEPDPLESERILQGHRALFAQMQDPF